MCKQAGLTENEGTFLLLFLLRTFASNFKRVSTRKDYTGVTCIKSHYTQQSTGKVSLHLAAPLVDVEAGKVAGSFPQISVFTFLTKLGGFERGPKT